MRPKLRFYPRSELGSDINPKAAILAKTEQRENYFWQHQIIAIMQHKYEHKMIESMIQMQFLLASHWKQPGPLNVSNVDTAEIISDLSPPFTGDWSVAA